MRPDICMATPVRPRATERAALTQSREPGVFALGPIRVGRADLPVVRSPGDKSFAYRNYESEYRAFLLWSSRLITTSKGQ